MKPATVLVCLAASTVTASANPRALPFTYTTDTLPEGKIELEQYVDLVALRAVSPVSSLAQWYLPSAFQTEIEIGLTDRLELGLYMTFVPDPGEAFANKAVFPGTGNGLKQRLRYLLADPGTWPIDAGVYGEIVENEREIELEAKLLLGARFGRLRIAANLSGEYELYYSKQREIVLNPSLGATYEITPSFHLGADSWLRGEYPDHPRPATRTFGLGPAAYVGPAAMFNFGKLWWAVAAYVRVTDVSHHLLPGEPYGPVYVRSMIGYEL
ncbi:MAG TPA: hypothetical protein VHN14_11780 [Kofleriaceae bacterium]|jgi:hypothetical protein|nr:hypothetical protein [Kofleriaceae bacterium]